MYKRQPGLHSSKQTPATFNEDGIERFLQEMDDMKMYPSIQHQIVHSLKLYIKDVTTHNKTPWKKNKNWENLIIPKNKEFLRFFNFEPKEQYLKCFLILYQVHQNLKKIDSHYHKQFLLHLLLVKILILKIQMK